MRVMPRPGDSPAELALMSEIDASWNDFVRLRKEMEAAQRREASLRARLRLLHEGLIEGELLIMTITKQQGRLETSIDLPYLWLRLLDKSGAPLKRRLKLEEGTPVSRPDGSQPVPLHPA